MYTCPRCPGERLVRTASQQGAFFECPTCQGRAVALAVIRRVVGQSSVKQLWGAVSRGEASAGVGCPVCSLTMAEVPIPTDTPALHLDVCKRCQFLWFDPHEFQQLALNAGPETPTELPLAVREFKALSDARVLELQSRETGFGNEPPEDAWKWLPAMLGLPVEHDVEPLRSRPWATWSVAILLAVVAALTFGNLRHYVYAYGFVPAEAFRLGGLTVITSFLLHGGLWHLIGNTYFLLIFGDNVEDHLGWARFVGLLAVASLVGSIAHALFDPRSGTPCIGASGGISGVIAFYAAQYPHARVGVIFRYLFMIRWMRLPAWAALLAWLLMQCLLAYMQVLGVGRVSAMAHLGGAAAGFAAWAYWRHFEREDLPQTTDESTDEIAEMFGRIRNAPEDVATFRQ